MKKKVMVQNHLTFLILLPKRDLQKIQEGMNHKI